MADMWQSIKNFFKKPIVWAGLAVAAVGGAVVASVAYLNDFTRPPIPVPGTPRDYSADLQRLDSSRPVGVFVFNVHTAFLRNTSVEGAEIAGINAARNNYIATMREHYGDNFIVIDDPSIADLTRFSNQFNQRFASSRPEVHIVANHHQNTYDDRQLAAFLQSIEATRKRALILSCGPVSEAYRNCGCDYVAIPAPDGQGLGAEFSPEICPAYRDAIGWMRNDLDAETMRQRFAERNLYNLTLEWQHRAGSFMESVTGGRSSHTYRPPVVITPPTNIPNMPGQSNANTP